MTFRLRPDVAEAAFVAADACDYGISAAVESVVFRASVPPVPR